MQLYIVEAVYEWPSYVVWGYEDLAEDLGATLIDLNGTEPYTDFATKGVPGGGEIYENYIFNHILEDVDGVDLVFREKSQDPVLCARPPHRLQWYGMKMPGEIYRPQN